MSQSGSKATAASMGAILTLTGNSGGAVSPTGAGNINTLGDTSTINITGNPGANTLTANVTGGTDGQLLIASTAGDPAWASLASADGTVTITPGSNTIDLAASGLLMWNEVTATTQAALQDNGYVTNNAALVDVALPTTATKLSVLRIKGLGAGGWKLSQAAGQSVVWDEAASTTTGASGRLESTDDNDAIELICTVADTTWSLLSSMGNITVV